MTQNNIINIRHKTGTYIHGTYIHDEIQTLEAAVTNNTNAKDEVRRVHPR